jgi:hypothetical protein
MVIEHRLDALLPLAALIGAVESGRQLLDGVHA